MKTNDYVKFLTQTVIKHMEQPKERKNFKEDRKKGKEEWLKDWFGILPYMLSRKMRRGN